MALRSLPRLTLSPSSSQVLATHSLEARRAGAANAARRAASTSSSNTHPLARKPQLVTSNPSDKQSSSNSGSRQSWSTATALLLATLTGAAVSIDCRSPHQRCILVWLTAYLPYRPCISLDIRVRDAILTKLANLNLLLHSNTQNTNHGRLQ